MTPALERKIDTGVNRKGQVCSGKGFSRCARRGDSGWVRFVLIENNRWERAVKRTRNTNETDNQETLGTGVLLEVRKKGGTGRVMNALKDKRYRRKIGSL